VYEPDLDGATMGFRCPECFNFSLFELARIKGNGVRANDLGDYIESSQVYTITKEFFEIRLVRYPPEIFSDMPLDLPESVERAYRQAERNRVLPDCEEVAAMAYRRSIENAIKETHPNSKGDLIKRIQSLGDSGDLPKAMVDWAHKVRITGNDGAHELEGVSTDDVDAVRNFADAFLRYLITFPAMVARRREQQKDENVHANLDTVDQ